MRQSWLPAVEQSTYRALPCLDIVPFLISPVHPETLPVATSGLQRDQSVQARRPKVQHHHQRHLDDRAANGSLAVDDPTGKEDEAGVEVYQRHDPSRYGQKLPSLLEKNPYRLFALLSCSIVRNQLTMGSPRSSNCSLATR